jgi:hypothetical protein
MTNKRLCALIVDAHSFHEAGFPGTLGHISCHWYEGQRRFRVSASVHR